MIIGFGFGSPLMALLMLLVTAFISYTLFKTFSKRTGRCDDSGYDAFDVEKYKAQRREYYKEQRQRAYDLMRQYDLSDEEIEQQIEEEIKQ